MLRMFSRKALLTRNSSRDNSSVTSEGFQHCTRVESSTVAEPPAFERARGECCETVKPVDPNILSETCAVLVIILLIERPASTNWKILDKNVQVSSRSARQPGPGIKAGEKTKHKERKICAIEITLRRIRNGTKPSV